MEMASEPVRNRQDISKFRFEFIVFLTISKGCEVSSPRFELCFLRVVLKISDLWLSTPSLIDHSRMIGGSNRMPVSLLLSLQSTSESFPDSSPKSPLVSIYWPSLFTVPLSHLQWNLLVLSTLGSADGTHGALCWSAHGDAKH